MTAYYKRNKRVISLIVALAFFVSSLMLSGAGHFCNDNDQGGGVVASSQNNNHQDNNHQCDDDDQGGVGRHRRGRGRDNGSEGPPDPSNSLTLIPGNNEEDEGKGPGLSNYTPKSC